MHAARSASECAHQHLKNLSPPPTSTDLTLSYLTYILEVNATAAFQREKKFPFVVNTGNYMVLPTPPGRALVKARQRRQLLFVFEATSGMQAVSPRQGRCTCFTHPSACCGCRPG